jgi:hypothetical protein
MRINVGIPESHVTAPVLNAALEATTRLNEAMLKAGEVPTFDQGLRHVKWKPEPPGAEHFDHAKKVLERGWGDCDDLAPWEAASLRHTGEDPGAVAVVRRSGPKSWHAIVKRGDGSLHTDPSRRAGMGQPHEYRGAVLPLMPRPTVSGINGVGAYIIRPQLALRPVPGGFQARTDLPWHYKSDPNATPSAADYAMVALHAEPVASTALTGSIDGAIRLAKAAGFAHPEHVKRLECLGDAIEGASFNELADLYGEEHARAAQQVIGSFFGKLKNIAKKAGNFAMKSVAPMAASFVPGGSAALQAAKSITSMIPRGGGGGAPVFPAITRTATALPGTAAVAPGGGQRTGRFVVTFD